LDPRCGKIRADVNRQIIQKIAHTAEGGVRPKSVFGSGLAGLGAFRLETAVIPQTLSSVRACRIAKFAVGLAVG